MKDDSERTGDQSDDESVPDEETRKAEQGQYGGTEDAEPETELDEEEATS